jgi:uncharacterized phage protein (TIGR02218 family)
MNRATYIEMLNRFTQTRTQYAECVKISRQDGMVFRFTAHDTDIKLMEDDGTLQVYKSAASFKMTAIENQSGLAVSNLNIDAIISDDSLTDADLSAGRFKFARVDLLLAYWSNKGVVPFPLKTTWIGAITMQDTSFRADLRGIAQQLSQIFTDVTSVQCRYNFCDTKCGLSQSTYATTYPITAMGLNDTFLFTPADFFASNYTWGKAIWVTGNNAGLAMEIISHVSSKITLFLDMPFPITTGDQVTLVRGCDKNYNTCQSYGNSRRFGGEPFTVGNDMLSRYPDAKA